jgi:hypothetical protein
MPLTVGIPHHFPDYPQALLFPRRQLVRFPSPVLAKERLPGTPYPLYVVTTGFGLPLRRRFLWALPLSARRCSTCSSTAGRWSAAPGPRSAVRLLVAGRSRPAAGFSHVVRYGCTSALGAGVVPSLLEAASHGPALLALAWVLLRRAVPWSGFTSS